MHGGAYHNAPCHGNAFVPFSPDPDLVVILRKYSGQLPRPYRLWGYTGLLTKAGYPPPSYSCSFAIWREGRLAVWCLKKW